MLYSNILIVYYVDMLLFKILGNIKTYKYAYITYLLTYLITYLLYSAIMIRSIFHIIQFPLIQEIFSKCILRSFVLEKYISRDVVRGIFLAILNVEPLYSKNNNTNNNKIL